MKEKQEKRGGYRINAGRKKLTYQTKKISFRIDVKHVEEIKKLVKDYLINKAPAAQ